MDNQCPVTVKNDKKGKRYIQKRDWASDWERSNRNFWKSKDPVKISRKNCSGTLGQCAKACIYL